MNLHNLDHKRGRTYGSRKKNAITTIAFLESDILRPWTRWAARATSMISTIISSIEINFHRTNCRKSAMYYWPRNDQLTKCVHLPAISVQGRFSSQFTAMMKIETTIQRVESPNVTQDALLCNLFGVKRKKRKIKLHFDK